MNNHFTKGLVSILTVLAFIGTTMPLTGAAEVDRGPFAFEQMAALQGIQRIQDQIPEVVQIFLNEQSPGEVDLESTRLLASDPDFQVYAGTDPLQKSVCTLIVSTVPIPNAETGEVVEWVSAHQCLPTSRFERNGHYLDVGTPNFKARLLIVPDRHIDSISTLGLGEMTGNVIELDYDGPRGEQIVETKGVPSLELRMGAEKE